jgi:O-antigen/teichoic acid export membrane protein
MKEINSIRNTIKNITVVGGSQLISIFISIVKTKCIALFLGASGIGLIHLFTTTIALVQSFFHLGLGVSGVRDLSEAYNDKDQLAIAKKVRVLKYWVICSSIIGIVFTILFSKQLSIWTFNDATYSIKFSVLSIIILINGLSTMYSSIIRAARNMIDFGKVTVYSSFIVTIVAICMYYFFSKEAIIPVLIISAIISLIFNIIFSSKIILYADSVSMSLKEVFFDGLDMVKLGAFTVFTSFISLATLYYVRVSIRDTMGIDYVGYYAAATTLTITYMGVIFSSMAADYFPKLSAINKDNQALNKAILDQTKIVLLLGTPLILLMFTFSDYIIPILYSKEFILSRVLLLWMLLAVFFQLISFPIGYVFLAKSKGKIFIFTQSQWNIVFIIGAFLSLKFDYGLEGIGIAFCTAYLLGLIVNIFIIRRVTNLKYDSTTKQYILFLALSVIAYLYYSLNYSGLVALVIKFSAFLLIFFYCYKKLEELLGLSLFSIAKEKFIKK